MLGVGVMRDPEVDLAHLGRQGADVELQVTLGKGVVAIADTSAIDTYFLAEVLVRLRLVDIGILAAVGTSCITAVVGPGAGPEDDLVSPCDALEKTKNQQQTKRNGCVNSSHCDSFSPLSNCSMMRTRRCRDSDLYSPSNPVYPCQGVESTDVV